MSTDIDSAEPKRAKVKRPYRGNPPHVRVAERRQKLLQAAVDVYGEFGFQKSTVQKVCDAAGLTKRYFYESFADPAALLAEAFRWISGEFIDELKAASEQEREPGLARSRSIMVTYFSLLRDDPGAARLFLLDSRGVSEEVDQILFDTRRRTAELIAPSTSRIATTHPVQFALQQLGATAGIMEISVAWIQDGYSTEIADLVEATLGLFLSILDDAEGKPVAPAPGR